MHDNVAITFGDREFCGFKTPMKILSTKTLYIILHVTKRVQLVHDCLQFMPDI